MKVWILGSGSSGNAVLLEGDGTRVLIDAGFGQDDIQKICHDNGAALVAPPV